MSDEQERRQGADGEALPDVDVVGFAPAKVKAKRWRPSTMAPLPSPSPSPSPSPREARPGFLDDADNDDAPAQVLRPLPTPMLGRNVRCPVCESPTGELCRRKDGSVAPGFHPQRLTADRSGKSPVTKTSSAAHGLAASEWSKTAGMAIKQR